MTVEEIFIKLKDELTAENESSSSPERIFIKNEEQTICTLGMNRSHEIIFVEFKPAPKDLADIEKQGFVHPHPVEMLHDAGWRQAQITTWEEAEKLLEIINRSYKRKKPRAQEDSIPAAKRLAALKNIRAAAKLAKKAAAAAKPAKPAPPAKPSKPAAKPKPKPAPKAKPKPKPKARAAAKPKPKPKPKPKAKPALKKKSRSTGRGR
jgi:outer membrane biosynthesis protein TonB